MISQWTNHLGDEADKEKFEKTILSAKPVLDRLIEITNDLERAIDFGELSLESFDTPNWATKQAFRLGQRQALKNIRKLITLK